MSVLFWNNFWFVYLSVVVVVFFFNLEISKQQQQLLKLQTEQYSGV